METAEPIWEASYVHFGNPDFVKLADSMGLKGYRVESTADFSHAQNGLGSRCSQRN